MNKKVTELMKDELGGKIMIAFIARRLKTYSYSADDANNIKKKKKEQRKV